MTGHAAEMVKQNFLEAELAAQAEALREARLAAQAIEDPNLSAHRMEAILREGNAFIKILMEEK